MRILLIEDSARVAETVSLALRGLGHSVVLAGGVGEADAAFDAHSFDMAIVDVGLPDGSGLEWCKSARDAGSAVPLLVLTARNAVGDRIAGLDAGADDYLGKPFSVEELAARVRALGRRGPRWSESVRTFGALAIDRDRRIATIDGVRVPLTPREFDIVALLAWRDGRVVQRDELLDAVWGDCTESAAGSCEVLLARLRRKLAERGVHDALRTVRQIGYAWALERTKPR
jgi:DNA-binding response OmpR family regulator